MSLQPKTRYTLQEYLDLEGSTEIRHEYLDGEIFALGGASWAHVVIVSNLATRLSAQLRERGCQVVSSESMTDYVLVSQDKVLVEHYSREPDGRCSTWRRTRRPTRHRSPRSAAC